ncbi:MAG: serine/threonine protein kinase [Planctomycetales bacterium]|nr:serine/threonine protein kinase [Planctomycetales bacterium]
MSNAGPNPERVQRMFLDALEVPADQRDAWLVDECGENHALLKEIRSLLEHDEAENDHLEQGLDADVLSGMGLLKDSQQGLHVRCPHCRNPILLVAELENVTCDSCGCSFNLLIPDRSDSYQPPENREFGHFQLIERVGIGSFGSVYKARDTKLNRIVALKLPRNSHLSREENEAFLREAKTAARLRHNHIVTVYEVGRYDDRVYIVSDFVEGTTLSAWLKERQPTKNEAARLCATIAWALHHAHQHGVVHRDLKPSNILLDGDNKPYLTDFGLAKTDASEITITSDGQILGTPEYMSPEQAAGQSQHVDLRTDVYSAGVVLYESLTGERPFRGSRSMVLHQVRTEDAPSPAQLDPTIPKDLETICLKCLEREPARRYSSAAALADDLERFLSGRPIQARPVTAVSRAWRWCKREPIKAGLIFALLTTTCLASYFANQAKRREAAATRGFVEGLEVSTEMLDQMFFELDANWPNDNRTKNTALRFLALIHDKVEDQLTKWDSVNPQTPEGVVVRAKHLHGLARSVDLQGVVNSDPELTADAEQHYLSCVAYCREQIGRWPQSADRIERVLAEALSNVGACYGSMANGAANKPSKQVIHLNAADKTLSEAEQLYQRLIRDDPSDADLNFKFSQHLISQGRVFELLKQDNFAAFRSYADSVRHADRFKELGGDSTTYRVLFDQGLSRVKRALRKLPRERAVAELRQHLYGSIEHRPGVRFQIAKALLVDDAPDHVEDFIAELVDTPDMSDYLAERPLIRANFLLSFRGFRDRSWLLHVSGADEVEPDAATK